MMRYQYVEIYMFTLGIMGLAMMAVRLLSLSTQVLCREYLSKSLGWMHKGAVSTFLVGTLHSLILHSKTMADLAAAGFTNAGLFQLTPMLSYIVGTGFGIAGFIFLFTNN